MYEGTSGGNLQGRHEEHTETEQKFVNLFDLIMLPSFCGKGYNIMCDSADMDDIMALITWNV